MALITVMCALNILLLITTSFGGVVVLAAGVLIFSVVAGEDAEISSKNGWKERAEEEGSGCVLTCQQGEGE